MLLFTLTWLLRDQPLFRSLPWDTVNDLYIILGIVMLISLIIRTLLPYPILRERDLFERAYQFHQQQDNDQALRAARQLIAGSPQWSDARYLLGRILNQQGKYREAARHLKFARELAPASIGVLLELGFAFRMLGKYQDAIDAFQQALALEPDNTYAAEQLEICQQEIHRDAES
jgi:tetratricopeptide (TPR) repeat protein